MFERIIQKKLFEYIEQFLSPFLCRYRKGFNTQTALLGLNEKWKAPLDKKGYARSVKGIQHCQPSVTISKIKCIRL